mgnify:CR=1 FL=1
MTIGGWVLFGIITSVVVAIAFFAYLVLDEPSSNVDLIIIALAGVLIFASYKGLNWYFTETASGQRAVVDQRSELNNGLERTINILNADGDVIRTYTGIIDIEGNDGGYVLFDYDGNRYTYYNCYLESIADIGE